MALSRPLNGRTKVPLNGVLNNSTPLALYVDLEDEEFIDNGSMEDASIPQVPLNIPTPDQFLQKSLPNCATLAPLAEMEKEDYSDTGSMEEETSFSQKSSTIQYQYESLQESLADCVSLVTRTEMEQEDCLDIVTVEDESNSQEPSNIPMEELGSQECLACRTCDAPHAEVDQEEWIDVENFEDAVDEQFPLYNRGLGGQMDLMGALADCEQAITLFFNNQLDEAIAVMSPWRRASLYHAHGASIFEFIPAVLTLEPAQIQRAQDALRQTFSLCADLRKNFTFVQSIGAIIKKPNYGSYTDEEAHAELVHCESLMLLACLGILENEDMTGLLRASLRIRTSYNGYKICAKILAKKNWVNMSSRAHFESGVRLGLATFNVMVALLPPRIVTVLEFVGFTADKDKGKAELLMGAQSPGLRSVLCELVLLVYYLVIGHFAAIPPDFNTAERVIYNGLQKFPNSIWFLMFKARTQLLQGKIIEAIEIYQMTAQMKNLWPQMKHLSYWELIWAFAMLRQWENAANYATILEQDSKWSRTIYMYAQGAMLIENGSQTPDAYNQINDLLMNAPCYKQKLFGRSLPMEKFVLRRCERWAARGYLVLPGVEWLYLWNIFPSLAVKRSNADMILKIIENTSATVYRVLRERKNKNAELDIEYDQDDQALVEFLHGSLLSAMSLPRLALQHLEIVLAIKDFIQDHTYLVPYATAEIAMCHFHLGDPFRAIELLNEARKKYSGYLLESRLHFRIHSRLEFVRCTTASGSNTKSNVKHGSSSKSNEWESSTSFEPAPGPSSDVTSTPIPNMNPNA